MKNEIRIPYSKLSAAIQVALEQRGVPEQIAKIEAEVMAESDLMDVHSHGVRMLPGLIQGIIDGRAVANPNIRIIRDHKATCVIDGENGPGRFVSVQAMNHAVERSKEYGIGACLAIHATHWGRAFAYAYRAAQSGTIGICMTNAITNMIAWNSMKPLLGNNPIAIGIPTRRKHPIVLDIAMSQAAVGKVGTYLREGRKVPFGWGLDTSGNPTDNPKDILTSGRILPFGDHKGVGLAVMVELLTGALSGMMLSHEISQNDTSGLDPNSSKLFIALDVNALGDQETLALKIGQLAQWLHKTEPDITVTFPGDRSWQASEYNLKNGIPIHPEILGELKKINVIL